MTGWQNAWGNKDKGTETTQGSCSQETYTNREEYRRKYNQTK